MKKEYESAELELVRYEDDDVLDISKLEGVDGSNDDGQGNYGELFGGQPNP